MFFYFVEFSLVKDRCTIHIMSIVNINLNSDRYKHIKERDRDNNKCFNACATNTINSSK